MAMITASSPFPANAPPPSSKCFPAPMQPATATSESSRSRRTLLSHFVIKNNKFSLDIVEDYVADWQEVGKANANDETLLYSFSPLPLPLLAALLGSTFFFNSSPIFSILDLMFIYVAMQSSIGNLTE
ncbi:hypothetical protein ACFX2I_032308 [Malus domestica]